MTPKAIIIFCLYFYFFQIGGLATTNILRLTADGTLNVLSSECRCDNCGTKITPLMQMPIVSYIFCRGRCRSCGIKLPYDQLLLEIVIFLGMSAIATVLRFSFESITYSFLYYEVVRIATIAIKGRRKIGFLKQYLIAVAAMVPFNLLTRFVVVLYHLV